MRKITLLVAIMAVFWTGNLFAGVVTTDQYKFLFNGVWTSTVPAGTVTVSSTTTAASTLFNAGSATAPAVTGNSVLFSAATSSAARGAAISNLNSGTALSTVKKEVLEFDWFVNSPVGDAMGYDAIGVSDGTSKPVFILMSEKWSSGGTTGYIHLMNLTPSKLTIGTTTSINAAAYVTTGDYRTDCANYFADSQIGTDFTNNNTYHVKAKLDFSTHTIDSIWITRSSFVYIGTNIAFLSATATNLNLVSAMASRGKNQTNSGNATGSATGLNQTIDNYYVYTWETASTTNVTVNYYDVDSPSTLITSVVRGSQGVGNTYTATGADQAAFTNSGYYCVYSSASLDNVSITGDGLAHVDLLMKKYPVTSATYQWTGAVDGTWNELNGNFTDGTNTLGYQPGNALLFPVSGTNKTITVNSNFSLGAGNDLTISGDGYTLQGTSTLTGTGKMNINLSGSQTASLNVTNNMTGITQIAGGSITLQKSGVLGATGVNITGAAALIAGANEISIPATTFGVSSTIQAGANYDLLMNGMSASSGVKISVSGSGNYANADSKRAFDFAASGTLSAGSELELNGTGTDNRMSMTSANTTYLANTKLTLKGNTLFYINTNQGAATTINVGTLAGDATSRLGWGRSSALDRTITWSVGALNENSDFAGTITNLGGYGTGGSSYSGNYTNLTKVGTGTLTLSGTSTGYNGNLTVNNGELAITGTVVGNNQATTPLANTVSVSGTSSKLSVSGTGSLTATTVTVGAGSKLDVGTGSTLTASTLNLSSDAANGSATFVNNGTATVTTANVQQYLTSGRNWYVSSPVSAAPYTALSTATKVYKYDEPSAQFVEVTTGTLSPLTGYISQTTTASSAVTFSGTLNDGVQTVTLPRTYGVTKAGFNLVGNPYASYVSWDAAEKTNLEPTMWYRSMNAGATSYVFDTYNATSSIGTSNNGEVVNSNIPPMQAFWVRVKPSVMGVDTTGTLTFRNSMRSHKGASDLKLKSRAMADATQQVLRLQVSNGTNSDEAVVYFNPNASDGLDDYDSPKMSNANAAIPEIYTLAGTEKLVINGLSAVTPEETLPLGFTTGQSNSFSIKATQITNFDGMKVYLRDNVLNTEQELTDASSYTFTSDIATTTTRFSVVFKAAGVTTGINASTDQAVVINKNANNQITVNCNGAINSDSFVSVYNALGQKVSAQQITASNTIISSSFNPGVYVVTVNNGNKTTTKKVILN
jgi:autotransporter-associated beta strand protein